MFNDIRIAPNQLYGREIQLPSKNNEQKTQEFSELVSGNTHTQERNDKKNVINLSSLGAPAGFCADISMLSKEDADALGIIQLNSNPHLL